MYENSLTKMGENVLEGTLMVDTILLNDRISLWNDNNYILHDNIYLKSLLQHTIGVNNIKYY